MIPLTFAFRVSTIGCRVSITSAGGILYEAYVQMHTGPYHRCSAARRYGFCANEYAKAWTRPQEARLLHRELGVRLRRETGSDGTGRENEQPPGRRVDGGRLLCRHSFPDEECFHGER